MNITKPASARTFWDRIRILPEVKEALEAGAPVVAFETTILSHGLPWPENFNLGIRVEEIAREEGCIPATVGIVEGNVCVGLTRQEVEYIARAQGVVKTGIKDIPWVVARKLWGGTTVSATVAIAAMGGVRVFATGGIGGVHRGAETTFDISSDLLAMAEHGVVVVSSGAKSILDIPKTLEYLETAGVPVVGYRSDRFAEFYLRESSMPVDLRAEEPSEVAEIAAAKWALGLKGGVLVSNPIPPEHELDRAAFDQALEIALKEAEEQGIRGKAITPFLLARIKNVTEGRSLSANIALMENNARLGARIAVELSKIS